MRNIDPTTTTIPEIKEAAEELIREVYLTRLVKHRFNISRAAKALGVSRESVYLAIKRYGWTDLHADLGPGPGPDRRGLDSPNSAEQV